MDESPSVVLLFGMPKIQCCRVGKKNTYQVSGACNKILCTVCQDTPVRHLHSSHPSVPTNPLLLTWICLGLETVHQDYV